MRGQLQNSRLHACGRLVLALASIAFALLPAMADAGAWGSGAFENDDAADLLAEIASSQGSTLIQHAFDEVHSSDGYIDEPVCSAAIAAATLIASAGGAKVAGLPPEAAKWLRETSFHPTGTLIADATKAVRTCSDPKRSELSQLWTEGKDSAAWKREIKTLLEQLAAIQKGAPKN